MPIQINSNNIALVDTSILVLILKVPNMGTDVEFIDAINDLGNKRSQNETIFLPMATIIETGNHIGQIVDGNIKHKCATAFVKLVKQALDIDEPFTILNFLEAKVLETWIEDFPNRVLEMGFGDYSIVKDWEQQCSEHIRSRVYIWSADRHLSGYDREPETN